MRFNNFSQTSKFAQKYIVFMGCSGHWELKPKYLRRFTIVEFLHYLFFFQSDSIGGKSQVVWVPAISFYFMCSAFDGFHVYSAFVGMVEAEAGMS